MLPRNSSLENLRFMKYILLLTSLFNGKFNICVPSLKVVGQLGMWGTLINAIQAGSLEYEDITGASWNGETSNLSPIVKY